METPKTHVEKSYVAVDQFQFLQVSQCDILPAQATPTPAPTEPPGRKLYLKLVFHTKLIFIFVCSNH